MRSMSLSGLSSEWFWYLERINIGIFVTVVFYFPLWRTIERNVHLSLLNYCNGT